MQKGRKEGYRNANEILLTYYQNRVKQFWRHLQKYIMKKDYAETKLHFLQCLAQDVQITIVNFCLALMLSAHMENMLNREKSIITEPNLVNIGPT